MALFVPGHAFPSPSWDHSDHHQLRSDTVGQHGFRGDVTATSRVSRETMGVPVPICFETPHFRITARVGAGVIVDHLGVSRRRRLTEHRQRGADIVPTSTLHTQGGQWFHVKPKVAFHRSSFLASTNPTPSALWIWIRGPDRLCRVMMVGTDPLTLGLERLPSPAPRLQHMSARCWVKAGSEPLPRSTRSARVRRRESGLPHTS